MRRPTLPLLVLACGVLLWSGCSRKHDGNAFLPSSPEFSGALVLAVSASSIPADGFSRLQVTAQITGGADLDKRMVQFTTDNGDFPRSQSGNTLAKTTTIEVNSSGSATVDLRSSTSPTIATITGQVMEGTGGSATAIAGLITRISVEFTPADAADILQLSSSRQVGEADGASVIFIHANVSPELPINQMVTFVTTLGTFTNGTITLNGKQTVVTPDIGRRATAALKSPDKAGEALITAMVMATTEEIRIRYDPALPEVIVVNLADVKLVRGGTETTGITVILSRAEGEVTVGTAVEYSAREKDYGEPIDLIFSNQQLSNADEEATADVSLGAVDFVGTATIRATVGGVFGEADIEIDAPAPQPDVSVTPDNLGFGAVTAGMTRDEDITIENNGDDTLIVSGLETGGGEFSIPAKPALPREVAPNGSFDITVRFSPTAAGLQSGTLRITSNDPDKPVLSVSLTGEGT